MDSPLLFLATALAILAAPGPTNVLFAMSGALHGVRRSLVLIPAGVAGYLIAVTLLGLSLGPALAASPAVARILRLLIGAYLFALAFRLWRKGSATDGRTAAVGAREVFVTTLLNPKALVFAVAVIPLGRPDVGLYLAAFAASVSLTGVGWLTIGAGAGRAAQSGGQARLISRVGSAVLAVFGGLLVYPAQAARGRMTRISIAATLPLTPLTLPQP